VGSRRAPRPLAAAPLEQAGAVRYRVPGQPYDTATGFPVGPNASRAVYGLTRQFFPVRDRARVGAIWQSQDPSDGGQIFVTWFGPDPEAAENTVGLQRTDERLAAAASDDDGTLFTFTVERGDGTPNAARHATLTRRTADGATTTVTPDTGRDGLNMVDFNERNSASMVVASWAGWVGLMFSRTVHQSDDGLNHQSGSACIFDATTLALTKNLGQTSGHSWASMMIRTRDRGQVIAAEIGDNYPRGLQIHRLYAESVASRVVYTYKTQHGSQPVNPANREAPVYAEISTPGKTFYQWSNDNQVYTELGGVTDAPFAEGSAYLVAFAGERPSLDNSKVGEHLSGARDLGVVLVREDFEAATRRESPTWSPSTWVTDDLFIGGAGTAEEGGYYTFGGDFQPQRVTGVVWLTDYPADKSRNASRVKVAQLGGDGDHSGDILLLWEVWGPDAYQETFWMTVRAHPGGVTVVKPATSLGTQVRLNPRDDLVYSDAAGQVFAVSGDGADRRLIVTAFGVDGPEAMARPDQEAPDQPAEGDGTATPAPPDDACRIVLASTC
jgi:hypothetical protein